jgi:glutaredoxin-related protein
VVLFMKGTPETPQCGFSRAAIQILGLQGVNPQKFTAFNVLEDEELRAGMLGDTLMKILDAMRSLCQCDRRIWLTER